MIAALELFASLLCIVAFSDQWPEDAAGGILLAGITDNRGNSFIANRLMSSRFPLVVILAELCMQMRKKGDGAQPRLGAARS